MNDAPTRSDVRRFVAACPTELRDIVEALRVGAQAALGDMREIVYRGAIGYTPTGRPRERVVYVAPQRAYVNLGFFAGTSLPDPHRILEGTGARMRHVKIAKLVVADSGAVRALLVAASALSR